MESETSEDDVARSRVWNGMARITLNAGETIAAKTDSAIGWSDGVSVSGGLASANPMSLLKNRVFGSKALTEASFTSAKDGAILIIADPECPGSVGEFRLRPHESIYLSRGSFLGRTAAVSLRNVSAGIAAVLQSVFVDGVDRLLEEAYTGESAGRVFFSAHGAIMPIIIPAGESYKIDNGHLIAFTASLGKSLSLAGSVAGSWMSGEGVAFCLAGPGTAFVQTQTRDRFVHTLAHDASFVKSLAASVATGGSALVHAVVESDGFKAAVRSHSEDVAVKSKL